MAAYKPESLLSRMHPGRCRTEGICRHGRKFHLTVGGGTINIKFLMSNF